MKKIILVLALVGSFRAMAISECGGKADDGTFVIVHVETVDAAGDIGPGKVTIEQGGNTFGYTFKASEVAQFFESDDRGTNTAMVGLSAAVDKQYPIFMKYDAKNFTDMDLHEVVKQNLNSNIQGSVMHVWKGPGYEATEQFNIASPVCAVWSNL